MLVLFCCDSRFCWHVFIYTHLLALFVWKLLIENLFCAWHHTGHWGSDGRYRRVMVRLGPKVLVSTPSSIWQWPNIKREQKCHSWLKIKTNISDDLKVIRNRKLLVWPELLACQAPGQKAEGCSAASQKMGNEPNSLLKGRSGVRRTLSPQPDFHYCVWSVKSCQHCQLWETIVLLEAVS